MFGVRPWCRDVAGKGAIRFSVVVAAQAGTRCGAWCGNRRVFWIPACAGMTGGRGFGGGCTGSGGGAAMSLQKA